MKALVFLCLVSGVLSSSDDGLLIQTKNGLVQGFEAANGIRSFLGIPYGTAPVGNLRWRPPQPAQPWSGVRPALNFAADCMQTIKPPYGVTNVSEDCLYVNVFAPANVSDTGLAVMVWINPGKFIGGAGHEYNGTELINAGNVVFVSFNHRVGVFGYLALPALATEDPAMGNYGQLDQRLALQWVQDNIMAFGGDPSRVTLFGESSGGISVCWHLVAQKSAGLFSQGLMESGFCDIWSLQQQQKLGAQFAANVSCTSTTASEQLACLRNQPAWALLNATLGQAYMLPTVDGVEIPEQPWALLAKGQFTNVPVLMGNNKNEAGLQVCPSYANMSSLLFEGAVIELYGAKIGFEILLRYQPWNFPTPAQALVTLATDGSFVCPTKQAARSIASFNGTVYNYIFSHQPGWSTPCYGVSHTFEIPFIFPNYVQFAYPGYTFTDAERQLSSDMINYWVSFANTGVPQGPVEWPVYNKSDYNMVLDETFSIESGYRTKQCEFWDTVNSANPTKRGNVVHATMLAMH
eukprot:TRINITY_DN5872_c0_g1_i1.p1 TRINITY_DN5872_c0_g1~~TRINITY_DN5872_c0_g1_i1.p1  ORF type:complete len:520 (-),score=207.47 TRINITY_DN5872_c0_g1_i1:315-1874(-)